jgi:hypothetical protein
MELHNISSIYFRSMAFQYKYEFNFRGPGQLSRYSDSLRAGRSVDQIPSAGEIFCTRLDRPWGPPSLLYHGYRVFAGGTEAGAWR